MSKNLILGLSVITLIVTLLVAFINFTSPDLIPAKDQIRVQELNEETLFQESSDVDTKPLLKQADEVKLGSALSNSDFTDGDVTSETFEPKLYTCSNMVCFSKKFTYCEIGEYTTPFQETVAVQAYYEILGKVATGGCSMRLRYVKNINPDWVNKDLVCSYDNQLYFNSAVESALQNIILGKKVCEGPLYEVLLSLGGGEGEAKELTDAKPKIIYLEKDDALTITGPDILASKGVVFYVSIDPASYATKELSRMENVAQFRVSETEPRPLMKLSDGKVEIGNFSVYVCGPVVAQMPDYENSGSKLKIGVAFNGATRDVESMDAILAVECKDTMRKVEELKSL